MKLNKIFKPFLNQINEIVFNLNTSKYFAGLMIILLNIGSKFVTIKLSKTMEAYLKYTFSKQILVFAIAWMGTRDIYVAILITFIFTILIEFLLNEESRFCCLPENFTNYHCDLLNNEINNHNTQKVSKEDIEKAYAILGKAQILGKTENNN
jgi:hypothetical protein